MFDWVIPKEWKVREAYLITPSGEKICDFSENNLHLLGYSIPFTGTLTLDELKNNLYLPDKPDAIPYVTSFFEDRWGFACLIINTQILRKAIIRYISILIIWMVF